jgi:hypothetical protein
MKTIFDHIEHAKGKPHHVRKQIAFSAAASATGFIALVWFVQSISSNAFAIQGTSFAESIGQEGVVVTATEDGNQNLAGAAAAFEANSGPAHIEIVDTASSTRKTKQVERTIIPF